MSINFMCLSQDNVKQGDFAFSIASNLIWRKDKVSICC